MTDSAYDANLLLHSCLSLFIWLIFKFLNSIEFTIYKSLIDLTKTTLAKDYIVGEMFSCFC
uniref:Uncharacterized protein n=1 Tax=Manihot esculenta TaxID=3983 RepID=A0A2C9W475_MANES